MLNSPMMALKIEISTLLPLLYQNNVIKNA